MNTIHKYILTTRDDQDISMPSGPSGIQLLHVAFQHGDLCLWARVDPGYPTRDVRVHIRGTGHPMGEAELGARHIGTVMSTSGNLVFHVFANTDEMVRT